MLLMIDWTFGSPVGISVYGTDVLVESHMSPPRSLKWLLAWHRWASDHRPGRMRQRELQMGFFHPPMAAHEYLFCERAGRVLEVGE